jgi:hypothetical protein
MIREVGLFAGSAMRESGRANKVARRA